MACCCVSATTGIAVAAPGLAHADDTDATIAAINAAAQFTQDVTNAGFYNSGGASAELLVGITACNRLDDGWTPAAEVKDLYENTSLNAFNSGRFVGIAMRDLCPVAYRAGLSAERPSRRESSDRFGRSQTLNPTRWLIEGAPHEN